MEAPRIAPAIPLIAQVPIYLDLIPSADEILFFNKSTICSTCNTKLSDYASGKIHEFIVHDTSGTLAYDDRTSDHIDLKLSKLEPRYFCPISGCRYELPAVKPDVDSKLRCFASLRYLKEHYLRLHSDPSKLQCSTCKLKCRTENELAIHKNISCGPSSCVCGKSIRSRSGYLKHMKNCEKALTLKKKEGLSRSRSSSTIFLVNKLNSHPSLSLRKVLPKAKESTSERTHRTASTLQLNSCVQTTETAFLPLRPSGVSRSAQCVPLNFQDFSKSTECSQTIEINSTVRDSSCQTLGVLKKTSVPLGIDTFTQTELLDENEGLSSRDARVLLDFLEYGPSVSAMETQTIESELAPFLLPSTSIETQTFACETDYFTMPSGGSLPLSPAMSMESLSTQTSALLDELIDEMVQVDMQTQTLDGSENCAVWEFTDADTQTCGQRYSMFE
ncbi:hypothetical protein RvY_01116 [Ramazzottius varieornatus]|uniref:C2H2-type domain-containing protein n=1 Tax=Ramazzottius varieornatus TaxID=947166 RepID=A0A1D1UQH1_RAMVA|nr:hypothetical protein RvY_01116 [Ramazzottius varieornatus]